MELTFVTDLGGTFTVEIDPNMELENVMALLEAEVRAPTDLSVSLPPPPSLALFVVLTRLCTPPLKSGIPVSEQSLSYEGRDLNNPKATMAQCGVGEKSMLLLRRKVHVPGTSRCVRILSASLVWGGLGAMKGVLRGCRAVEQDAEMMRLQILGDPQLMGQLRQVSPSSPFPTVYPTFRPWIHSLYSLCSCSFCSLLFLCFCPCPCPCTGNAQTAPEILDAAQHNPARFADLIRQTRQRHMDAQSDADRERMLLEADPFSLDAQRKIEEAIQQQAVLDNLEHALEYSPEFFGRVTML